MQRISSRNSAIRPIHALAAAVIAAGALSISAPAVAAPVGDASAASISGVVLVGGRGGNGHQGKGKDRGASHLMKQGDDRADRDDDWRRDDDDVEDRDDRGHAQGHGDHGDRGHHYGWVRGNHYGWDKNGKDRDLDDLRFGDRPDWRAERRHSRWTGQDIGRVNASVLRDYDAYNLPRPGPGQYYARSGNDVYLVTERTQRIMDAFMLRDLLR